MAKTYTFKNPGFAGVGAKEFKRSVPEENKLWKSGNQIYQLSGGQASKFDPRAYAIEKTGRESAGSLQEGYDLLGIDQSKIPEFNLGDVGQYVKNEYNPNIGWINAGNTFQTQKMTAEQLQKSYGTYGGESAPGASSERDLGPGEAPKLVTGAGGPVDAGGQPIADPAAQAGGVSGTKYIRPDGQVMTPANAEEEANFKKLGWQTQGGTTEAQPGSGERLLGPSEFESLRTSLGVGEGNFDQFFRRDEKGNIYLKGEAGVATGASGGPTGAGTPQDGTGTPPSGERRLGPSEFVSLRKELGVGPENFDQFFRRDEQGNIFLKKQAGGATGGVGTGVGRPTDGRIYPADRPPEGYRHVFDENGNRSTVKIDEDGTITSPDGAGAVADGQPNDFTQFYEKQQQDSEKFYTDLLDKIGTQQKEFLQSYMDQPSMVDNLKRLREEQGLPQLEKEIALIDRQVLDTEKLLDKLEGDISKRTAGFPVSESARRRMLALEGKPLTEQINDLVRSRTRLGVGLEQKEKLISNVLNLEQEERERQLEGEKMSLDFGTERLGAVEGLFTQGQERKEQAFTQHMNQVAAEIEADAKLSAEEREFYLEIAKEEEMKRLKLGRYSNDDEVKTKIVTGGGRTLLINTQTGETIKDLGSAYKASGGGGGSGSSGGGGITASSQHLSFDEWLGQVEQEKKINYNIDDPKVKSQLDTGYQAYLNETLQGDIKGLQKLLTTTDKQKMYSQGLDTNKAGDIDTYLRAKGTGSSGGGGGIINPFQ